jgi:HlyD family secretion protein
MPAKPIFAKRMMLAGLAVAVAAAFAYALAPRPAEIDSATVQRGDLRVTADEEGRTRIREIYSVSAPTAGRIRRITLHPGDEVRKDETVVATIEPAVPSFLDVRARRELEALVAAAEAAVNLADAEVRQAEVELGFAQADLQRARSLIQRDVVSQRNLQRAEADFETRKAAVARAVAGRDLRRRELDSARARLIGPDNAAATATPAGCCVPILAPANGRVLRILKESEQVVQQGVPILEIGDPADIEIVVELLSTDAVRIAPGAAATIDGWGGPPLPARVLRIDPAGFKKVSALGIEEQRVEVVLTPDGSPQQRARLGHDFHVFSRIEVTTRRDAILLPLGALFRTGDRWTVYVFSEGRARLRRVEIGERNTHAAEVMAGLEPGERVILHPSDRVGDGVRARERPAAIISAR